MELNLSEEQFFNISHYAHAIWRVVSRFFLLRDDTLSEINRFIDDRSIWSFNILPSIQDLPLKVEVVTESELDRTFFYKLLDTLYWGYSVKGGKSYSQFFSDVFWVSRDHLVLLDGSLTGRLYHGYKRFESEKYADIAAMEYIKEGRNIAITATNLK